MLYSKSSASSNSYRWGILFAENTFFNCNFKQVWVCIIANEFCLFSFAVKCYWIRNDWELCENSTTVLTSCCSLWTQNTKHETACGHLIRPAVCCMNCKIVSESEQSTVEERQNSAYSHLSLSVRQWLITFIQSCWGAITRRPQPFWKGVWTQQGSSFHYPPLEFFWISRRLQRQCWIPSLQTQIAKQGWNGVKCNDRAKKTQNKNVSLIFKDARSFTT